MKSLIAPLLAVALICAGALPSRADNFSPAQRDEIGDIVKNYLLTHPEVMRQALEALDAHEKQAQADAQKKVVSDNSDILFSSPYQATVGNPKGDVTLVEFFDYNCHFCKGALPDIARLMKTDPNLKVVLKDFPVLGPGSVEAAQVASAVRKQLTGEKFWEFHRKLLGGHGPVGKEQAMAVAKELGVDMVRLQKDMESPDVRAGIEQVMRVADTLQINGTPSFVIGQDVVVGAVGYDQLKEKIDSVHKCGHATC